MTNEQTPAAPTSPDRSIGVNQRVVFNTQSRESAEEQKSQRINGNVYRMEFTAGQVLRIPQAGESFLLEAQEGDVSGIEISIRDQDSFCLLVPGEAVNTEAENLAWIRCASAAVLYVRVGTGSRRVVNSFYDYSPTMSVIREPWLVQGAIAVSVVIAGSLNPNGMIIVAGTTLRMPRTGAETDFVQLLVQSATGAATRYLGSAMPGSPFILPRSIRMPPGWRVSVRGIGSIAYEVNVIRL